MIEGVAVVLGQRSLGRSSDMSKNEARSRLRGDAMQVRAVPSRDRRREETRGGTELRVGIEADTKAICVVLAASCILQQMRLS